MKKAFTHGLIGLAMMTGPLLSFGQDFLPALNDNFMGINQAFLQPASIADSPLEVDVNIAGINNSIYNDGMLFRSRWLIYPAQIVTNENWWDENTYLPAPNGQNKNMLMSQSIWGPGIMITSKNHKFALGFTSRIRSITNMDKMHEPLFRLMYTNYQATEYYNKWFHGGQMRAIQHVFGDYGLTFAREVYKGDLCYVKAGCTFRLLQGIAASYIQPDEIYYYFNGDAYPNAKLISYNSPYVKAGISDNWGDIDDDGNYSFSMNYQLTAKPSVGFDFGFDLEFRKRSLDTVLSRHGIDSCKFLNAYKILKPEDYIIKFGFSILDVGRLKYLKDYESSDFSAAFTPDYLERYNLSDNSVPENTNWLDANYFSFTYKNYVPFFNEMHTRSVSGQGVNEDNYNKDYFRAWLPLSISFQMDIRMPYKGLYLNIMTFNGINQRFSHTPKTHNISNYSITPRFEFKWFGISVPVQINQYKKLDVGLGLRLGIVYVGVNNFWTNIFNDPYGINAYIGVKIPIYSKKEHEIRNHHDNIQEPIKDINKMDSYVINIDKSVKSYSFDNRSFRINESPSSGDINSMRVESFQDTVYRQDTVFLPIAISYKKEINFETAKFELSVADKALLDNYIIDLKKNPLQKLKVTGYTDNIGKDSTNLNLSLKRARETAQYLFENGISSDQIIIDYKGEDDPLESNSTEFGRSKNRRVELELINPDKIPIKRKEVQIQVEPQLELILPIDSTKIE